MNDDSMPTLFIFIPIIALFGLGYTIGFTMGEQFSQHETINFCVEKPELCKQRYEYLKLREKLGEY